MNAALPQLMTVGRISVDLYGQQLGAGWSDVRTFAKAVGGSATNVAVAAARLGTPAAVLTKVGDDPLGAYLRDELREMGVDTRWIGTHAGLPTPLALAVTAPPDDPQLAFYRWPAAPDLQLRPRDLSDDVATAVDVLWLTGTGFSAEPSRGAHHHWLAARGRGGGIHTVLDLDHRPTLWADIGEAGEQMAAALPHVTVAVGNRSECEVAVGSAEPDRAADLLLEAGVALAIIKGGGAGVMLATADERTILAPQAVEVVCGLGAGDAFGGAIAHGLVAGWEPARLVAYANAAGAIVASRLLCADDMPTHDEVEQLVSAGSMTRAQP